MGLIRSVVIKFIKLFEILLIVRAIISWFPMSDNAIVNFIFNVTEPMLAPIRKQLRKIPALNRIPFDLSIIVLFILLDLLRFSIY